MPKEITTRLKDHYLKLQAINNPYDLDESTTAILGLFTELTEKSRYEELSAKAIIDITATLELEVVESIEAYEKVQNSNDSKQKAIYDELMNKALMQVRLDLATLIHAFEVTPV